ncbi:PoNe immunity protein domain-containing protein, partial [Pseudomonas syringae]|uniref:PoNe immunity protein domain-containing protein n=2 Tax=Pseudomonas syringae TaxID=317 RepID=UPI001071BA13
MKKRQKFYSKNYYINFLKEYDEVIEFCKTNTFEADSPEEEASLRAEQLQSMLFDKIFACYTSGEEIEALIPLIEELIEKYETWQKKLSILEQTPKISPLAIDDWSYQYEECVQVISLCILLHRTDLLKRFVSLLDEAGYAGDDTLYEDLLRKTLPNRQDIDQWYHDVYTLLIQAIYADPKEKSSKLLSEYCKQWYPAFKQAPWHDTHLQGEEGNYVGYWAFEAGAIAFLYGIDDSKIDHMVYPKDLVEYARNYQGTNGTQVNRVVAGNPCTKTG